MVPDVARICIESDSETELGPLLNIQIPEGKLEFFYCKDWKASRICRGDGVHAVLAVG